jgi:nitrite reductase/ring-hydroxylating ferredoxin subunit
VRVDVGPATAIPESTCVPVAGGAVVVVRLGAELRAYRNRCLHQDSPLEGGWVRDGVISCPLHFWRYRFDDGAHIGGRGGLERFPVRVEDGVVVVEVPDPAPAPSLRAQLLERARSYDRDRAWRQRGGADP